MMNPADICRECELASKTRELEEAIKELMFAIDDLELCTSCVRESGEMVCAQCPWLQAKVKAIRLLAKGEE